MVWEHIKWFTEVLLEIRTWDIFQIKHICMKSLYKTLVKILSARTSMLSYWKMEKH